MDEDEEELSYPTEITIPNAPIAAGSLDGLARRGRTCGSVINPVLGQGTLWITNKVKAAGRTNVKVYKIERFKKYC